MRYVARPWGSEVIKARCVLSQERLLATVRELGQASSGLVAWELSLPEEEVRPAWEAAVAGGLLDAGPSTSTPASGCTA